MRLLRPTPGECVDRQTILQLKCKHGQSLDEQVVKDEGNRLDEVFANGAEKTTTIIKTKLSNPSKINIQPFIDENNAIQDYLQSAWLPDIGNHPEKQASYDVLFSELEDINGRIWMLEDQARVLGSAPGKFVHEAAVLAAQTLFDINMFNDARARVVKSINAIWNINVQEKLH